MSAARSSGERPRAPEGGPGRSSDMAHLRARRRAARRRTRAARIDLALGLLGALVLLLATPGLAITGLITIVVLAVCIASLVRERRRRTHEDQPEAPVRRSRTSDALAAARNGRRAAEHNAREPRTRSTR